MKPGCYTALITPFKKGRVDYEGIDRLTAFQIENGISGILAVGTTGESPTLSWDEHNDVIAAVAENSTDDCICIAGTGSNNTRETLAGTRHAQEVGARAVLLVRQNRAWTVCFWWIPTTMAPVPLKYEGNMWRRWQRRSRN